MPVSGSAEVDLPLAILLDEVDLILLPAGGDGHRGGVAIDLGVADLDVVSESERGLSRPAVECRLEAVLTRVSAPGGALGGRLAEQVADLTSVLVGQRGVEVLRHLLGRVVTAAAAAAGDREGEGENECGE